MTAPLYRRVLGPAFDQMPATLRDFHDVTGEKVITATFKVTRGGGWLRALVCRLGRLPAAGEAVPVRLRVTQEGETEVWHREFGAHELRSVQRHQDGLMVETFWPWTLGFRLILDGASLRLQPETAWLLGIRWPLRLAPGGSGVETGLEEGVAVVVQLTAPLLGLVAQYEGLVRARPESPS